MKHLTKRCCRCGETKPLAEFHRRTASADGRQTACKLCERTYHRARDIVASWVRDEHQDVWQWALDEAARELGVTRQPWERAS